MPDPAVRLVLRCVFARVQYDDVWERRDVLGVHAQKQEGFSWVGACVPTGRIFPQDFYDFADAAEKCARLPGCCRKPACTHAACKVCMHACTLWETPFPVGRQGSGC